MVTDTDSATNRLLERDADVDALSDRQIKDCYARSQFIHAIIEAHGPAFMRSPECKEIEEALAECEPKGLKETAIRALGRDHPVADSLGWENGPGNVETLFDRLTKDDYSEEELVEQARRQLKNALRGTGMPRQSVARERVKAHANGETDL